MTIYEIDNVIEMVEECRGTNNPVATVWEYVNVGNKQTMYAVFTSACYNDIYESPYVWMPKCIYIQETWIGDYEYLNRV